MSKPIHYKGKELSMYERGAHNLSKMMWWYTYCGYLFVLGDESRLTTKRKKVTCKHCLNKLKRHGY